jgi:hypothetical protein
LKTATWIAIGSLAGVIVAISHGEFAVAAVIIAAAVLLYQNHVLETKLNRLLDEAGITVRDDDIP